MASQHWLSQHPGLDSMLQAVKEHKKAVQDTCPSAQMYSDGSNGQRTNVCCEKEVARSLQAQMTGKVEGQERLDNRPGLT